jgi:hypothetical protein
MLLSIVNVVTSTLKMRGRRNSGAEWRIQGPGEGKPNLKNKPPPSILLSRGRERLPA